MNMYFNLTSLLSALLFVTLGLAIYVAALRILLPVLAAMLRKQIGEEHGGSLAIALGFLALGIGIIIASAVH